MHRDAEALWILRQGSIAPNGTLGRSPLSIAAEHGSVPVMRELLERGARIDDTDRDQHTALWFASVENHPEAIRVLVEHGAAKDLGLALHVAAWKGHFDAVEALIASGSNVNFRGPGGETPLAAAVKNEGRLWNLKGRYAEVIAFLVRHGADPDLRSDDGLTASSIAKLRGDSSLVKAATKTAGSGCYIATSVYGSYNAPEVRVLRRFRDQALAKTPVGRVLIVVYYAASVPLIRMVGNQMWFNALARPLLDALVMHLQRVGFDRSPYSDPRVWH